MNNTFGFNPNNLFFPFAYQFAHSTTNIYWCHPELFCNVVYPNLQIFLNNSTNSIVVTPPCAVPPDTKANEEEKQIAKKRQHLQKKYTKKGDYDIRTIAAADFAFEPIVNEDPEAEQKLVAKQRKKDKKGKAAKGKPH